MSRDPLRVPDYLDHIREAISRIQKYCEDIDQTAFLLNPLVQDAVIRNFEIIGEASKNVPQNIKVKYQNIPWDEMYRLRNRISHEYFGIDYEILWDIARNYLPQNHEDILKVIKSEG